MSNNGFKQQPERYWINFRKSITLRKMMKCWNRLSREDIGPAQFYKTEMTF